MQNNTVLETTIEPMSEQPIARKSADLYERLVLKALSGLTEGYLRMTLPDGYEISVGVSTSEVQATMVIKNPDFFRKCVLFGDVGFGESYVDGDWETDNITDVIRWMIINVDKHPSMSGSNQRFSSINWLRVVNKITHLFRPNTFQGSRKNIQEHYDLSNEFFQLILDPSMMYSSGFYSSSEETLETAQAKKLEKLCEKLKLRPTDHLLEIGSGWGGLAIFAAQHYGCRVTTVTISEKQFALAKERIHAAGLDEKIDIRLQDYRLLTGTYDKIVSVEMLEAVGHQFLKPYFKKCHDLLAPNGIFAVQVITCPDSRYESLRKGVDWIQKHIFPGSLLPSIAAINGAVNATGTMVLHHLEDISPSYARTLSTWRTNMNERWKEVRALGFDDNFKRKWNYYFSYCEAAFAMRNIAVVQMVYTRPNNRQL